jgi:hypothetical protein
VWPNWAATKARRVTSLAVKKLHFMMMITSDGKKFARRLDDRSAEAARGSQILKEAE